MGAQKKTTRAVVAFKGMAKAKAARLGALVSAVLGSGYFTKEVADALAKLYDIGYDYRGTDDLHEVVFKNKQ